LTGFVCIRHGVVSLVILRSAGPHWRVNGDRGGVRGGAEKEHNIVERIGREFGELRREGSEDGTGDGGEGDGRAEADT